MPRLLMLSVGLTALTACAAPTETSAPAPAPVYDESRRLLRLDWDRNGDGRLDQRTYMRGTIPLRSEIDDDGDDRVDRWEYVFGNGQVSHVGTSSGNDGIEDTWTWPPDQNGEARIERAQYRDRIPDRREYFRADVLVRADEDGNRDGVPDKWETWERGVLRVAAFDTSFRTGRPDRRVIYGERGQFEYLDADPDGDGRFERATRQETAAPGKEPRE